MAARLRSVPPLRGSAAGDAVPLSEAGDDAAGEALEPARKGLPGPSAPAGLAAAAMEQQELLPQMRQEQGSGVPAGGAVVLPVSGQAHQQTMKVR
jgi:hypothetical protein